MRLDCAVCFGGQHQSFYSHTAWNVPHWKRLSTNLKYVHMMTVLTLHNRNEWTHMHTHTDFTGFEWSQLHVQFDFKWRHATQWGVQLCHSSSKSWSTYSPCDAYIAANHWGPCNLPLLLWILRTQVLTDDQKQTLFCSSILFTFPLLPTSFPLHINWCKSA